MYCIKSHNHFQVSPSTSEIFNKNLKIGRFYPGLPYNVSNCYGLPNFIQPKRVTVLPLLCMQDSMLTGCYGVLNDEIR